RPHHLRRHHAAVDEPRQLRAPQGQVRPAGGQAGVSWLDPHVVLPLAGYTPPADPTPLPSNLAAAVAFAEQAIAARTRLTWGSTTTEILTVRLSAASYLLRLPKDVQEIVSVTPAIS